MTGLEDADGPVVHSAASEETKGADGEAASEPGVAAAIADTAHVADAVLHGELRDDRKHCRPEVQVLMAVEVRDPKARIAHALDLRAELGFDILPGEDERDVI